MVFLERAMMPDYPFACDPASIPCSLVLTAMLRKLVEPCGSATWPFDIIMEEVYEYIASLVFPGFGCRKVGVPLASLCSLGSVVTFSAFPHHLSTIIVDTNAHGLRIARCPG